MTVTRRVYRSGESQYLLNGAPCRLKDIVELFLDTGVGKGAYAFVSQSEIDAVLSARPEDRRELFEEAAGIKKYRVKKREALRKLESGRGQSEPRARHSARTGGAARADGAAGAGRAALSSAAGATARDRGRPAGRGVAEGGLRTVCRQDRSATTIRRTC